MKEQKQTWKQSLLIQLLWIKLVLQIKRVLEAS